MRKVNSNQFQQAEKKISLRQKYYGTPCSLLFLGQTLETKGSIIKRPHTIPLLYSGSEHCPLQMPPNGFLVSQITTSQWTKT